MEEENKEEVYESDFMFQNNAVNAEPVFPSPFNSKIGNSTIDLSVKANNDKMLEEYNNWWTMVELKSLVFYLL